MSIGRSLLNRRRNGRQRYAHGTGGLLRGYDKDGAQAWPGLTSFLRRRADAESCLHEKNFRVVTRAGGR